MSDLAPAEALRRQLDALFAEWKLARGRGRGFAEDGPLMPEQYLKADLKVLFVLKEPSNDGFEVHGGLLGWLRAEDSKFGGTWNVLARWAGDLLERPIEAGLSGKALRAAALDTLGHVAVMNLKKYDPQERTDALELAAYTAQDASFIRRQIALLQPDVVVGCGVKTELVWLLGIGPGELQQPADDALKVWSVRRPEQVVLFVRHPGIGAPAALGGALARALRRAKAGSPG